MLGIDAELSGQPAAGFTLVLQLRGEDEEGSQGWEHCACHGMISLDLTAAGRSCGRGETRRRPRKTSGQEDRQKRAGGTSPAGALARVPCSHTKGVPFPLASKDGGIGRYFFFESQNKQLCWRIVPRTALHGRARTSRNLGEWGRVNRRTGTVEEFSFISHHPNCQSGHMGVVALYAPISNSLF